MKTIKLVMLCFLALLSSCQNDDEYEAPDALSDMAWYTSVFPGSPFNVSAEKDFISFLDASQGAITHEWVIEEGSFFLRPGFTAGDSLPAFIDEELGLTSTDKTVHVMFVKEGLNTVCLKNTFGEQVTIQTEDGPISAVQDGDEWVFEKCFEVDVFAKDVKPAFKVLKDGEEILNIGADDKTSDDPSTWPVVDVEVNKTLTFVDLSLVGRPNFRTWNITGTPETSNDSIVEVAFLNFGTTTNVGNIRSSRIDPLPQTSNFRAIPLKVRVVSSSQPFEILSEITEDETEKLSFQVAGVIDQASLVGENGNFTVNVVNAAAGFDKDIAVQSIGVNETDGSILELTLAEPIYNSDEILVSYVGGDIQSTDKRTLEIFNDKKVIPHLGDSVLEADERYSFEIEDDRGDGGNTAGFWTQHNNPWYFWGTQEITAADGVRVVRYHADDFSAAPDVSWLWGLPAAETAALVPNAGTYRLSIEVFRESGSTIGALALNTNPDWVVSVIDFSEGPDGQWIKYSADIQLTGAMERLNVGVRKFDNPGVSGSQTFYIDDIRLTPLEARP
ncbi:hypothetical protein [Zobellia galactanivorans]|uniref:hypothetical protein n=1 Tax=Zobellia galactanivorans (strain DSM 12802 / CCUG 47099 / CIP 106680 / NCIMB 13871 / Dsij) TaxID=63186 RepID=UPI001C07BFD2|nr:hypothetical protein [Zobellia galactanivorans]MBU3026243.1 hypothetical protein [Zobellia galactanivorans]